jgi:hypothetical protein
MQAGEKKENQSEFKNIVELLEPTYKFPQRDTKLVQETVTGNEWHH